MPFIGKTQQSVFPPYITLGKDGLLKYKPDEQGNTIPDFSQVGYHHNHRAIPDVREVKRLTPSGGDDLVQIQAAVDELAKMTPDENGFRGAIVFSNGIYKISGTIRVSQSGIVLRGDIGPTILVATGKGKRDLIHVNGRGSPKEVPGSRRKIIDEIVPAGAKSFRVSSVKGLVPGDKVILFRPGTAEWINAIKMDQIEKRDDSTRQWQPAEYDLHFERQVTKIEGNRIFLDNPVMMPLEKRFGGAEIYKYEFDGRIQEVGIEYLTLESEFVNDEDEDHGWVGVYFNRVENCWARNIFVRYFGYSAIHLGSHAKNVSVGLCVFSKPKSKITGSRRYSFNNDGQQNYFGYCQASEGRHDFVTGARTLGPNVFFGCTAENAKADIGPHHRWSVGTLYEQITTDGEINVQDRGNWGTGHGWAGVTQVLWNCQATTAVVQSPWASGKNYAIGIRAKKSAGRLPARPDGEWALSGAYKPALPSLFRAQSRDRDHEFLSVNEKMIKAAYGHEILKNAEWAMKQHPVTITSFRAPRSAGSIHDFYSEGDYWWPNPLSPDSPYIQRDGMTNPDNFTAHRQAMIRFSRIVGALAAGYKLTGNRHYLIQAMNHCKAWFIDSATKMNPSLLFAQAIKGRATGRGIGIIDTIHLVEIARAIELMFDVLWEYDTIFSIKIWFARYLEWLTTHSYGKDEMNAKNNHGTCWVMQVAAFASLTDNQELLGTCRERYKKVLLPEQMATDGSFPLELKRTKPYGYSIFNLDAMAMICEILSTPMDDLWNYTTPDGKSIRKGIEYLYPYIKDKKSWPHKQDVMYWNEWPVAPPFLYFGAAKFSMPEWMDTWRRLKHFPTNKEVIRNLPVRNVIIW